MNILYKKATPVKMRILLQFLLLGLFTIGMPVAMQATHIVGGEISYRCLGSNRYEITLKVYRDCFNGLEDFDRPAFLGIYDLEGSLVTRVDIPFSGIRDTLNPSLNDPCLVVPGNVCVDTTTYRTTVLLGPNPRGGAYQITYVRCCRNKIINNIVAPEETGAVYDIILTNEAMQRCNNSPVFEKLPPNYICADKPFVFDHSATDADGDSLVYSLCTPFSAGSITNPKPRPTFSPTNNAPPFDEVEWQPGFGLENLFGLGEPLRIDPQTGLLTAVPGLQGTFVVGVCVDEYDRVTGQWLSRTRRDFQYDVGLCGNATVAAFTPVDTCGLSVRFENNSLDANNFQWFFDYPNTALSSTEVNPIFTFPAPGNYRVALVAEPNSACTDTAFADITVVENTLEAQLGLEIFDCDATSILQLTDRSEDPVSPIVSREWLITYGDVVTLRFEVQDTAIVLPIGAQGTVQLTVTNANACVATIEQPFATGDNSLPIDEIRDTLIACAGDEVALNPDANPNSGFLYQWSPGELLSDSTAVNPTFIATQNTTFTVRISPTTPVCSAEKTVTVIVNPRPIVNLGDDQTICQRDSITIEAMVEGGTPPYQFAWNRNLPTEPSHRVAPLISGNYIVTVTDANGCTAIDSVLVTVNVTPAVIAFSDRIGICQGESATLDAIVNGGTPPITFAWNQGLDFVQTQVVSPLITTEYRVTVTTADGCTATDSVIVNVDPTPTIAIVDTTCAPDLQSYSIRINSNSDSVRTSIGTLVRNGIGDYSIINIPNGQAVTVTATFAGPGCDRSVTFEGLNCADCPDIEPPTNNGDREICADEAIPTLSVSVPEGQTADWYDAPTGGTLLLAGAIEFAPLVAGTYYAEARDLLTNCTSETRTPVILTINPTPMLTASADRMVVCAGDLVVLSAAAEGGQPPYAYLWNQNLGSGETRNARPVQTTTYAVTTTDDNGCMAMAEVTVTVNPLPVIRFIDTECSDDLMSYTVRITTDGDAVISDVGTVVNDGGGNFRIINIPIDVNVVIVSIFDATDCRSTLPIGAPDCDCDNVTIEPPVSDGDVTICIGDAIPPLRATAANGQTVDWYDAPVDGNLLFAGSLTFTPPAAGTYYAETRDLLTGCVSRTRTPITLTINEAPAVEAIADRSIVCPGETAMLSANATGGTAPYIFTWDNDLGEGRNQSVNPISTTTYTVTVTDALNCTATATITITVNPNPEVSITTDRDTICAGENANLSATGIGGQPPYTFNWSDGSSGANPTVSPTETTIYTVTITDENGCTNVSAPLTIVVNPRPEVSADANRSTICEGDSTLIFAIATGGTEPYSYEWDNGLGNASSHIVTPTATTTYNVTVTDANGCTNTASVTVTVTPGLDVSISTDAVNNQVCEGNAATLTANVGNGVAPFSYNWDNDLPAEATVTVMPLLTTTYSVTVTDAVGCIGEATITITVNPNPEVSIATDRDTICAGENANLSATGLGGQPPYTFNWSDGSSGNNPTVSPTETTIYTVTITDENGCTNVSAPLTIVVNPRPEVSADVNRSTICEGDSTLIFAIATGGTEPYSYEWDNGLGNASSHIVTPTATTTYNVTVTDANGCTNTASVTVTVTPGLDVSISTDAVNNQVCEGNAATLTANVGNGVAPFRYNWDNDLPAEATVTITPLVTTTYSVTVTDAVGCIGEATITITVNPNPEVSIATDRDTICAGENANLSATGIGGQPPYTFNWSDGSSGANPTVSPTETTIYTVTITDENGCTNVSEPLTIVVNPRPEVSADATEPVICVGASTTLLGNAQGGTPPYTFEWSNGISDPTQVVSPVITTTYTLTVTDANGCQNQASVTIVVNPPIDVTISTARETICEGDTATLVAIANNGIAPFTYQWSTGETTEIIEVTTTGTYRVTVTDDTGCVGEADISITVTSAPMPDITSNLERDTICPGEMVVLNVSSTGGTGDIVYTWSNGATGDQQTVNPLETTTFIVTATDDNGCMGMDTITIPVFPMVVAEIAIVTGNDTICPGDLVVLEVTPTAGVPPFTYVWDNDLGTDAVQNVNPVQTTTYNVTVTDANGCEATASITIVVAPIDASVPDEIIVCLPTDEAVITVTNLDANQILTYAWSPAGAIISGGNAETVRINPTLTNVFTVALENQFGCRDTLMGIIRIIDLPATLVATVNPDTINRGETAQLNAQGCMDCTYTWTSAPNDNTISNPNIANPTVSPSETTTYTVQVTDTNGCSASASVTLVVRSCDPVVFLPNAFTPNGDGVNDVWRMRSNSLQQLKDEGEAYLVVYNRWGQKVFETRDPFVGWDGTLNGRQLPPDVYGYRVVTVCPGGERYENQGNVTLLR